MCVCCVGCFGPGCLRVSVRHPRILSTPGPGASPAFVIAGSLSCTGHLGFCVCSTTYMGRFGPTPITLAQCWLVGNARASSVVQQGAPRAGAIEFGVVSSWAGPLTPQKSVTNYVMTLFHLIIYNNTMKFLPGFSCYTVIIQLMTLF